MTKQESIDQIRGALYKAYLAGSGDGSKIGGRSGHNSYKEAPLLYDRISTVPKMTRKQFVEVYRKACSGGFGYLPIFGNALWRGIVELGIGERKEQRVDGYGRRLYDEHSSRETGEAIKIGRRDTDYL